MSVDGVGEYRPYAEYKDTRVDWLGDIPGHWEILKLRRVLQRRRYKNDDGKELCFRCLLIAEWLSKNMTTRL